MFDFKRVLGFAWAAPVTAVGLVYVALFARLGWYKRLGIMGNALVWQLNPDKAPAWLNQRWAAWGGHTIGNVVVVRFNVDTDRGRVTLRHEQEHCLQCMRLGIFWPVLYFLSYLAIRLGCPKSDPYYSNVFEVDARRAAGQLVDVEGAARVSKPRS